MTLTPEQHAELNAFCAEKVMKAWSGWTADAKAVYYRYRDDGKGTEMLENFKPTTSPADAMAVQKACALKVGKDSDTTCTGLVVIPPTEADPTWTITHNGDNPPIVSGETLEITLCLFARQLYTEEKR